MKYLPVLFILITSYAMAQLPVSFEDGDFYGFKDEKGNIVLEAKYEYASDFFEPGLAAVVYEGKWYYIDLKGKLLIEPYVVDNGPDYFSEGLARYGKDGEIGFFNEFGEKVIKANYTFAEPFKEGMSRVNVGGTYEMMGEYNMLKGGKWGFINREGKLIIETRYDFANDFENGIAWVKSGELEFYIDKAGEIVSPEAVDSILGKADEMPPVQMIMGGEEATQKYAGECWREFKKKIFDLNLRIANDIVEGKEIDDSYVDTAAEYWNIYFNQMKGGINISEQHIREVTKEEIEKQKKLYEGIQELIKVFAANNIELEIVECGYWNSRTLWDMGASPGYMLKQKDGHQLYFAYPLRYGITHDYSVPRSAPISASVVSITQKYILFTPFDNAVVLGVNEKIFEAPKPIESSDDAKGNIYLYTDFLLIDPVKEYNLEQAIEVMEKHERSAVILGDPFKFKAYIITDIEDPYDLFIELF